MRMAGVCLPLLSNGSSCRELRASGDEEVFAVTIIPHDLMVMSSCHTSCWILNTVLVQYEAFLPRKTVVHYREVLVKEKIKAFRINESVLEAFRIILAEFIIHDFSL